MENIRNKNKIYIYNDTGCVDVDTLQLFITNQFANTGIEIAKINSTQIKEGILNESVLAFFMPGGIANDYFFKLCGDGNKKIKDYVSAGGTYFGICAGAYYACRDVKFEEDSEELKINAKYGLNLFNGIAKGTLHKEFGISRFSKNINSTAIVDLHTPNQENSPKQDYASLYHGGPFFDDAECDFETFADYTINNKKNLYQSHQTQKHAIISCNFGKGKVILSGVHFEIGPQDFEKLLPLMKENAQYLKILNEIKVKENKRQQLLSDLMKKVRN